MGSKSIPAVIRDFDCSGATEDSAAICDLLRTSPGARHIAGHMVMLGSCLRICHCWSLMTLPVSNSKVVGAGEEKAIVRVSGVGVRGAVGLAVSVCGGFRPFWTVVGAFFPQSLLHHCRDREKTRVVVWIQRDLFVALG